MIVPVIGAAAFGKEHPAMKVTITYLAAGMLCLGITSSPHAQAPGADDQAAVTASAIEAAKARLNGSTSLSDKIAKASAKSDEVHTSIQARATALAGETSGMTAEQLRARFAGNAQIAKAEAKPCDQPTAILPDNGTGLCAPGKSEH